MEMITIETQDIWRVPSTVEAFCERAGRPREWFHGNAVLLPAALLPPDAWVPLEERDEIVQGAYITPAFLDIEQLLTAWEVPWCAYTFDETVKEEEWREHGSCILAILTSRQMMVLSERLVLLRMQQEEKQALPLT